MERQGQGLGQGAPGTVVTWNQDSNQRMALTQLQRLVLEGMSPRRPNPISYQKQNKTKTHKPAIFFSGVFHFLSVRMNSEILDVASGPSLKTPGLRFMI